MRKTVIILGALFGITLSTSNAFAQPTPEDVATARALGQDGIEALEKKEFAKAADLLRRADALYHVPSLALGLARAHVGLGKLVQAYEMYNRIVREGLPAGMSDLMAQAVEDAKRELPALEARLPTVIITVTGPADPVVSIDGVAVSQASLGVKRFIDPGEHTVRASADGYVPSEAKLSATEGRSEAVTLTLELARASPPKEPSPSKEPSPRVVAKTGPPDRATARGSSFQRTIGFVSLGAGVGALGIGAAMGGVALTDDADLQDRCPDGQCPHVELSRTEGYERMRWLAVGSLAAGGALAITGTTLVLTSDKESEAAPPQRAIGAGLLGVGVAGLALGATTGALALDVSSGLDGCDEDACPPSQQGSLESASSLRTLSFVGLGIGAASLGVGIALMATAAPPSSTGAASPGAQRGVRLTPYVGPLGGGVHGVF